MKPNKKEERKEQGKMRKFYFSFSMFPVAVLGYVHIDENILYHIYHIHAFLKVRIIPIINYHFHGKQLHQVVVCAGLLFSFLASKVSVC